jgi:hypothetical protein
MAHPDRPTERRTHADYARMRRVLIEERQAKTLEHVRSSVGYADDVSPHAHDAATFRLINQRKELDTLQDAGYVLPALDHWKHWSKMNNWDSRNRYLERLIEKLQRRQATSGEIQTLVTICRPTWVKIARQLRESGGDLPVDVQGDHRREEAIRVQDLDRGEVNQVMRHALLGTLLRCPRPIPRFFFPWLEKVLTYRALDHVRHELTENGSRPFDGAIHTVVDQVLADPDAYGAEYFRLPASPAHDQWLRTLDLPTIFDLAESTPHTRAPAQPASEPWIVSQIGSVK